MIIKGSPFHHFFPNLSKDPPTKKKGKNWIFRKFDKNFHEDDMDVLKPPSHDLGITCVSTDPRRSGQLVGVENLILTKEEIRNLLEIQSKSDDQ